MNPCLKAEPQPYRLKLPIAPLPSLGLAGIILLVAKLSGVSISWIWALFPFYIVPLLYAVLVGGYTALLTFGHGVLLIVAAIYKIYEYMRS